VTRVAQPGRQGAAALKAAAQARAQELGLVVNGRYTVTEKYMRRDRGSYSVRVEAIRVHRDVRFVAVAYGEFRFAKDAGDRYNPTARRSYFGRHFYIATDDLVAVEPVQ
jgi:hypothetical protein